MTRAFIPVPKCLSVELIYTNNTIVCENVFHVLLPAPASSADVVAIRTIFNSWDSATWAARRTNNVFLTRIRTKALDSLGSPVEDFTLPTPRVGALTGLTPSNASFCLRLGTGLSGRSYRGRLYTVGLSTTSYSSGSIMNAAEANALVAAVNTLIANLAAGSPTSKLVVVSYRNNKLWRATGVATAITTVGYADLNLDSQRRRLPGRGI